MIDPVPRELNLNNLRDVFESILHLEAFIFFGTLLGYQREGNVILYDDDIDVYVNSKHFEQLIEALIDIHFDVIVMPKKRWHHWRRMPLIVQASRWQNGIQTFVDFYLYDDEAPDYLIEKWNFRGTWKDPMTTLHIPKNLIFPLLDGDMQGIKIRVPAQPESLCAFLYGSGWKVPIRKDRYVMEIVDHGPVFKVRSTNINCMKWFWGKINAIIGRIHYWI